MSMDHSEQIVVVYNQRFKKKDMTYGDLFVFTLTNRIAIDRRMLVKGKY